ncbi:hypothetical protein [Bradyrhizobium sp. ORS 111]|uniref:hypothetical protein n=1 Tax=Bradyrhizobium sp. ORS 111 TaxID=1685958 RepID=UPI00388DC4B3
MAAKPFAYSTNHLAVVENAIITDIEATTAIGQSELLATKRMIERSPERPTSIRIGSSAQRLWFGRDARPSVCEHEIEPHTTMFDKSIRVDGTFSRDDSFYAISTDVLSETGTAARPHRRLRH